MPIWVLLWVFNVVLVHVVHSYVSPDCRNCLALCAGLPTPYPKGPCPKKTKMVIQLAAETQSCEPGNGFGSPPADRCYQIKWDPGQKNWAVYSGNITGWDKNTAGVEYLLEVNSLDAVTTVEIERDLEFVRELAASGIPLLPSIRDDCQSFESCHACFSAGCYYLKAEARCSSYCEDLENCYGNFLGVSPPFNIRGCPGSGLCSGFRTCEGCYQAGCFWSGRAAGRFPCALDCGKSPCYGSGTFSDRPCPAEDPISHQPPFPATPVLSSVDGVEVLSIKMGGFCSSGGSYCFLIRRSGLPAYFHNAFTFRLS